MNNSFKVGYYSDRAANLYGSFIYEDVEGNEFEVTVVYNTLAAAEKSYMWPDKVLVSDKLVKFVRKGQ